MFNIPDFSDRNCDNPLRLSLKFLFANLHLFFGLYDIFLFSSRFFAHEAEA